MCNCLKKGELDEKVVVRKFRTTTHHSTMAGKTQQSEVKSYNLDVIISSYLVSEKILLRDKNSLYSISAIDRNELSGLVAKSECDLKSRPDSFA